MRQASNGAEKAAQTNKTSKTNKDQNNQTDPNWSNSLVEQEIKIARLRSELQKEEREARAEIAESAAKLRGLTLEENKLKASIQSLEMAIKALGQVKTAFEKTIETAPN